MLLIKIIIEVEYTVYYILRLNKLQIIYYSERGHPATEKATNTGSIIEKVDEELKENNRLRFFIIYFGRANKQKQYN